MIKSVAVYLGSATVAERYHRLAYDFGHGLAERGIRVVYGGAAVGTMQSLSEGVLDAGGEIMGVFPRGFRGKREVAARGINIEQKDATSIVEVEDFAERKKLMTAMSDCCVILPGGFGTLDELFCHAVGNEIGEHDKKAYVLNEGGFYDGLRQQMETMRSESFLGRDYSIITFLDSKEDFFALL